MNPHKAQEIGDLARMEKKDKLYAIQPVSDRGFCRHGSEAAPLPVALDTHECELPLFMGPDADEPDAEIKIRALIGGGISDTKVWFRLNHTLLEPEKKGDWYTVEIPQGVMRAGKNKLAIWCNAGLADSGNPMIVKRIFVPVSYS